MQTKHYTFTLPIATAEGTIPLRVISRPVSSDVVYAGIAVATGTRHEAESESGMAHLVEHMSFKGTPRLSSMQILNRMESVGGDLNAYTGKEETIYYATFLRQHLNRAIPLLLDIVFSSTYPQAELEKEVEVVIDEIESYNDSPAELIYDDFEALLFPDQPLGRNILGKAERLREYRSEDLRRFARRCYHPSRAVLFVRGDVSEKDIRRMAAKSLSALGADAQIQAEKDWVEKVCCEQEQQESALGKAEGKLSVVTKPVHQAHVMIGNRTYAATDPRRYGLVLLNNLLGGPAMNSRLSLALRERAGLVYTVESNLTTYTDTGVWSVYLGCDPGDVRRCLRIVHRELQRLIDAPLTPRTLATAKQQLLGQLGISYENAESVTLSMAKRYLHYGTILTHTQLTQYIEALTATELQQIAAEIFNPSQLTTLIYQPE